MPLRLSYVAMLIFTILGSFWLELALKIGVLRRVKRLFISVFPVSVIFVLWDAYAIKSGHWHFDSKQIVGLYGPFNIPLEEFLFFIVIPIASIMTIESVRTVKKHWVVGDEEQ